MYFSKSFFAELFWGTMLTRMEQLQNYGNFANISVKYMYKAKRTYLIGENQRILLLTLNFTQSQLKSLVKSHDQNSTKYM